MDETEGTVLSGIPAQALTLRLPRSTIKMRHAASWRVDKWNEVHDLIICLRGSAHYRLDDDDVTLRPGEGMLIPAGSRFVGRIGAGEESYTGIAQHFALDLFGDVDLISQMEFARVVPLPNWDRMEHLVRLYRDIAPAASTTLAQHHLFMVILLAFLSTAFRGWRAGAVDPIGGQDTLSLHIVLAASRIAANPGGDDALGSALGPGAVQWRLFPPCLPGQDRPDASKVHGIQADGEGAQHAGDRPAREGDRRQAGLQRRLLFLAHVPPPHGRQSGELPSQGRLGGELNGIKCPGAGGRRIRACAAVSPGNVTG